MWLQPHSAMRRIHPLHSGQAEPTGAQEWPCQKFTSIRALFVPPITTKEEYTPFIKGEHSGWTIHTETTFPPVDHQLNGSSHLQPEMHTIPTLCGLQEGAIQSKGADCNVLGTKITVCHKYYFYRFRVLDRTKHGSVYILLCWRWPECSLKWRSLERWSVFQ